MIPDWLRKKRDLVEVVCRYLEGEEVWKDMKIALAVRPDRLHERVEIKHLAVARLIWDEIRKKLVIVTEKWSPQTTHWIQRHTIWYRDYVMSEGEDGWCLNPPITFELNWSIELL